MSGTHVTVSLTTQDISLIQWLIHNHVHPKLVCALDDDAPIKVLYEKISVDCHKVNGEDNKK